MTIAVMGCVRTLPPEFPISKAENSGNMVHGDAPFRILPGAVSSNDTGYWRGRGFRNFVDFVNEESSHLVLTLANTLRLDKESLPNLDRMSTFLDKVKVPVVVFGLGAQSQSSSIDDQIVPPEAVRLLRKVSAKTPQIGVRGEFTARILKEKVGIDDAYVTGCPSIFSRPEGIVDLRASLTHITGTPSFNGTKYHQATEKVLLSEAVQNGHYIVEPVNKFNHAYHIESYRAPEEASVPYFLRRRDYSAEPHLEPGKLKAHFSSKYRLFRGLDDWVAFNRESVSYTYGTRFHVNMASFISGRPALWLTHDARTRELVDYLGLPSRPDKEFRTKQLQSIDWHAEYARFFREFEGIRSRFEHYLHINGLPVDSVTREAFSEENVAI